MNNRPLQNGSHDQFWLPESLRLEMLAHSIACLPEEACGLVGRKQVDFHPMIASVVLPIENEYHSPVRFRMAPAEQLKAFYWLEEHNLELAAIFHSHPQGPEHPSETDLAEFAYPGVLMLILAPLSPTVPLNVALNWQIRSFQIDSGHSQRTQKMIATEISLVNISASQPGKR